MKVWMSRGFPVSGIAAILIIVAKMDSAALVKSHAITSGASLSTMETLQPLSSFTHIKDRRERSIAIFEEIGKVVAHPRCLNCHPATEHPTQTDAMRLHNPLVVRGKDGKGAAAMHCSTCHHTANFDSASVPGDSKWALAPASMAWQGKTLGQICTQLKNRKLNGGRDLTALTEHMAEDHLVGWGWHPGGQLTPAPGSQAEFGALFREWVKAGASCPE